MARKQRKLVVQVVGAGALAAALGGAFAAWVSAMTARSMVERNEDAQLLRVAEEFADEIDEEIAEPLSDDSEEEQRHFRQVHGEHTLANIIEHEMEELRYPGPGAVVRQPPHPDQGATGLPVLSAGTCATDEVAHRRACAVPLQQGGVLTLAISTQHASSRNELFRVGIVVGAAVGGILGGLASFFLGRWILLPLGDLRSRVRQVKAEQPSVAVLSGGSPYPEELEELRHAIADLVARLNETLLQAQSFATHAAHELRTPLTALSGELELLIESTADKTELLRMKDQLDRLTTLIQRLLVLASSASSMEQNGETIDCGDLVMSVVAGLTPEERARAHTEVAEDLFVRGDEQLLCVLLNNALGNALKFSTAEVTVSARRTHAQVWIEVEDRGPGIPPRERSLVFSPFYRTQSARGGGVPGHGIGLALIAHVARIHSGEARFMDVDTGSRLRIELPLWTSLQDDVP